MARQRRDTRVLAWYALLRVAMHLQWQGLMRFAARKLVRRAFLLTERNRP